MYVRYVCLYGVCTLCMHVYRGLLPPRRMAILFYGIRIQFPQLIQCIGFTSEFAESACPDDTYTYTYTYPCLRDAPCPTLRLCIRTAPLSIGCFYVSVCLSVSCKSACVSTREVILCLCIHIYVSELYLSRMVRSYQHQLAITGNQFTCSHTPTCPPPYMQHAHFVSGPSWLLKHQPLQWLQCIIADRIRRWGS